MAAGGSDGAFLPCSFWLADNFVLQGRVDDARAVFERLAAVANDVGLLAEEYDPVAGRLVGNFPQAFTHVALVNTAHNLGLVRGPAQRRADAWPVSRRHASTSRSSAARPTRVTTSTPFPNR